MTSAAHPSQARILDLDAVRGFALCGIIFANAAAIVGLEPLLSDGSVNPVSDWLYHWVTGHFFPIFSLLFGIGFGIMWRSAQRHAPRPRLVMARRLAFLILLGALHHLLQPSEALLYYGIAAAVFLLPATFLPPRWQAPILGLTGLPLLFVGAWFGGILFIPGLFIAGFWLGTSDMVRRAFSPIPAVLLMLLGGAVAAYVYAVNGLPPTPASHLDSLFATGSAAVYLGGFVLLLHTPLRRVLGGIFAPLGRTALTNYLSATVLIWGLIGLDRVLNVIDPVTVAGWQIVMLACVAILLVQWIVSAAWLQAFTQGPLEWVWRRFTWLGARGQPLRRSAQPVAASAPEVVVPAGLAVRHAAQHP